jgi:hypothetical protein
VPNNLLEYQMCIVQDLQEVLCLKYLFYVMVLTQFRRSKELQLFPQIQNIFSNNNHPSLSQKEGTTRSNSILLIIYSFSFPFPFLFCPFLFLFFVFFMFLPCSPIFESGILLSASSFMQSVFCIATAVQLIIHCNILA